MEGADGLLGDDFINDIMNLHLDVIKQKPSPPNPGVLSQTENDSLIGSDEEASFKADKNSGSIKLKTQ